MKKICLFFLLIFLFPCLVKAKDLCLDELTILNGEISPEFEPLNNSYTIILAKNIYNIEFEYEVSDEIEVEVLDNFDLENNSVVEIVLKNEKNEVKYHFQILKEEEEKVYTTFLENLIETQNNFMYEYKNYIIPSCCLFLIFLTKRILFPRKKHKK